MFLNKITKHYKIVSKVMAPIEKIKYDLEQMEIEVKPEKRGELRAKHPEHGELTINFDPRHNHFSIVKGGKPMGFEVLREDIDAKRVLTFFGKRR